MSTRRAVVSGLGPNGVTAALELLRRGYQVVVVEKRSEFTRPIHLHLRASYLEDVRRLSPELHRRLMRIATPIEENSRAATSASAVAPRELRDRRARPRQGEPCCVWSRLSTRPERHVRLNNAETICCRYLEELASEPGSLLSLRRGFVLALHPRADGFFEVSLEQPGTGPVENLGAPDLVVIAEGGKSATVRKLGLKSVRFSYPKYFMSAHVDVPFGPRTRRIDTDLRSLKSEPGLPPTEISLWASGHGESDEGTWIVLEVPEALLDQPPEQAEEYFLRGATLLMEDIVSPPGAEQLRERLRSAQKGARLGRKGARSAGWEAAPRATFAGTFKFEQQCLRHPAAGKNVVVLGDAAGMGHHALSSGLEMGALDLTPLGRLCQRLSDGEDPTPALEDYAEAVFDSRLRLLAMGMNEYYPDSADGRLAMLHRAATLLGEDDA